MKTDEMTNFSCQKTWSIDSLAHARLGFRRLGDYNMFKLPKLAGNWNTKTPHAAGLHQPARVCSSYCDVTGERVHEAVPALSAWSRQRRSRQRRQALKIYLPHGIQIRWKFNFADRVIATITRHLCCCSMCITLQRCDSQEMNCNMYMISHRILMIEQLYFVIADKVIIIYRYLGFICFYHLA